MKTKFELEDQTATLVSINPRPEKHGDENVPAADLKVEVREGNHILSRLHPSLRFFLYKADESEGHLEEVEPPMNTLRFGRIIEKIGLNMALKGADVKVGFGLGGSSDIELSTVDVDSFSVVLMEGGTIALQFRIKAKPTGDQIKKLYEVMGCEITISVTPAEEKQGALGLPHEVGV